MFKKMFVRRGVKIKTVAREAVCADIVFSSEPLSIKHSLNIQDERSYFPCHLLFDFPVITVLVSLSKV